jgi:hypothetical protein
MLFLFIVGLSLVLISTNFGISLGGNAIIIAYSGGLISFKSAALGLTALFGNSGLSAAVLSKSITTSEIFYLVLISTISLVYPILIVLPAV